jgi:hypothetical protein
MNDYPPPNPAQWLGDPLAGRSASDSPDTRSEAPQRLEEVITWDSVRSARRILPHPEERQP